MSPPSPPKAPVGAEKEVGVPRTAPVLLRHLLIGDVLARLRELPSESVDVVATSPPYFGLRSYLPADDANKYLEIGAEETPAAYITRLVEVGREIRRVLKPSGTWWINIGDSYANDAKWGGRSGGKHAAGLHGATGVGRGKVQTGLKPKDLIGIPYLLAFALRDDGWYWRSNIVWAKAISGDVREGTAMPESVTDRPQAAHETVLLMAKSERYYYDAFAVREAASSTHGSGNGFKREKRESYANTDGTYRGNETPREAGPTATGNLRNVWRINPKPYKGAHYAVWPEALVEQIPKAGAPQKVCASCGKPWARITGRPCENPDGCAEIVPTQGKACPKCGHVRDWKVGRATNGNDEDWSTAGNGVPRLPGNYKRKTVVVSDDRKDLHGPTYSRHRSSIPGGQSLVDTNAPKPSGVFAPTCSCPPADPIPGAVLDPFMGSGTTAAVAERMGLRWIGIDLDPRNAELLAERVRKETPAAEWEISEGAAEKSAERVDLPAHAEEAAPLEDDVLAEEEAFVGIDEDDETPAPTDDGGKAQPLLRVIEHPTVKAQPVMQWLLRAATALSPDPSLPILDTFAGTGSTLVAAKAEGINAIGIERDPTYAKIAAYRINNQKGPPR